VWHVNFHCFAPPCLSIHAPPPNWISEPPPNVCWNMCQWTQIVHTNVGDLACLRTHVRGTYVRNNVRNVRACLPATGLHSGMFTEICEHMFAHVRRTHVRRAEKPSMFATDLRYTYRHIYIYIYTHTWTYNIYIYIYIYIQFAARRAATVPFSAGLVASKLQVFLLSGTVRCVHFTSILELQGTHVCACGLHVGGFWSSRAGLWIPLGAFW